MKWLRIENQGELPKEALSLMGASTKRASNTAIGMFGTGAKYALAVLLREGVEVEVHTTSSPADGSLSEEKRFRFRYEEVSLRGETFHQIYLREGGERTGTPLNFTTEMGGLNWTVEAGLRELVSNAMDEPEPGVEVVEEGLQARPGYTRVYVRFTPKVKEFWEKFDTMFTFRRVPVYEGGGWKVFAPNGGEARVYRRGVLVWIGAGSDELCGKGSACFDYDLQELDVNEERKAEKWTVQASVGSRVVDNLPLEGKKKVLESAAREGSFEAELNVRFDLRSQEWGQLVGQKVVLTSQLYSFLAEEMSNMETLVLPENWVLEFEYRNIGRKPGDVLSTDKLKGFKMLEPEELTLAEKNRLTAAVQFLLKAGIAPECPVWAFEAGPDNIILGEYLPKEDRIVINRKQLQVSKRAVVETLFEEVMHRRSGEGDKTRAFQNALRAAWVDMAQEKVGEWL